MILSQLKDHFAKITPHKIDVAEWPGGAVWLKPVTAAQAMELESRIKGKTDTEIAITVVYLLAVDEAGEWLFENTVEAEAVATLQTIPVGTLKAIANKALDFTKPDALGN